MPLAEYRTVKDEQRTRIGFRDDLLHVTLTVLAAVIAASAQAGQGGQGRQAGQAAMLLALPPVCVVLGWTCLVNEEKISAIGAYARGEGGLGPRLARLAGAEGVSDWEVVHRTDARRWSRKTIQRGIDPPAFYFVPLAGPLVHWVSGVTGPGLVVLSAAGALTVIGVGVQVIPYAKPPT